MDIPVFFCEPTGRIRGWLRRYAGGTACTHPGNYGYHDAHVLVIPDAPELFEAQEETQFQHFPKNDARWPTKCACGYVFQEHHQWQYTTRRIYRRADTGGEFVMRSVEGGSEAPVGAMWDANWYDCKPGLDTRVGADGMSLYVMIPGNHTWTPDARASNCGSPCKHCGVPYRVHNTASCSNPGEPTRSSTKGQYVDSRPEHRCWVRHGDPRTGQVHVDKAGVTCDAGAGSILFHNYHGFLHHGRLTNC